MKKIVCVQKCYDGKRIWEQGDTREILDNAAIPGHFALLGGKPEVVIAPARYNPMEPVVFKQNHPVVPRGGMATGLASAEIKPMVTAGSEAIRKAKEAEESSNKESVLQKIIKPRGRPRKI